MTAVVDDATADTLADVAGLLLEHGETQRALIMLRGLKDLAPSHPALPGLLLDAACRARDPSLALPVEGARPIPVRERIMRAMLLVIEGRLNEAGQMLGTVSSRSSPRASIPGGDRR